MSAEHRAADLVASTGRLREEWRSRAAEIGLDRDQLDAVLDRRAPGRPVPPDLHATAEELSAPAGITEHASTFDRRDVIRDWAAAHREGVDAKRVETLADRWLASDHALPLERGERRQHLGGPRYRPRRCSRWRHGSSPRQSIGAGLTQRACRPRGRRGARPTGTGQYRTGRYGPAPHDLPSTARRSRGSPTTSTKAMVLPRDRCWSSTRPAWWALGRSTAPASRQGARLDRRVPRPRPDRVPSQGRRAARDARRRLVRSGPDSTGDAVMMAHRRVDVAELNA
ncbi:MAG: hypothetical protein QOF86_2908, partial [Baekduia sp.]|nr:hypothetical protein [Baekduia sp.]